MHNYYNFANLVLTFKYYEYEKALSVYCRISGSKCFCNRETCQHDKKADAGEGTPTVITDDDIPSDYEMYTFTRQSGCVYISFWENGSSVTDRKFSVALGSDGTVYIKNPMWWLDNMDSWVKGTYDSDTGIISIPTGQYLYWNSSNNYGAVLVWGNTWATADINTETGEATYKIESEVDNSVESIQFRFDGSNIYLLSSGGDIYLGAPMSYFTTGMMCIWSDDLSFICSEVSLFDEDGNLYPFGSIVDLNPAIPADPKADDWYDCGDESGFSKLYFTLPTTDVEGNPIDSECLSYSIFIDNGNGPEIFTFTGKEYTYDLAEDDAITEVPYWLYSNAVDFKDYLCYMYHTNAEGYTPLFTKNIGIQVYYTVDGVRNASNIAWLYNNSNPYVSAEVSEAGMATYCSYQAIDFSAAPEGLKAYIITGVDDNGYTLITQEVTGIAAPGTGLLLEAPEGTYDLKIATSDTYDELSANKLVGVTADTEAPIGSYLLQNQSQIGFYKVEEGTRITIPAGRAYLSAGIAASGVKGLLFGDSATGINNLNVNLNQKIYNLAGQCLQKVQKGINIINGKKVLK